MATLGKLALFFVVRFDGERTSVYVCSQCIRDYDAARQNLDVVAVNERPNLEVRTKDPGTSCTSNHNGDGGEEGCCPG